MRSSYLLLVWNPVDKNYSCAILKIIFCSNVIQMWMWIQMWIVSVIINTPAGDILVKKSSLSHEEFLAYLSESTKPCLLILCLCIPWLTLDLRQNSKLLYLLFNRSEKAIRSHVFLKLWQKNMGRVVGFLKLTLNRN